ncbi:MAG: hypothetical protein IPP25_21255 [Saprospiraceae bacterium]|nr:hypothetical protein [Candidatus Opimibacter skivensis]
MKSILPCSCPVPVKLTLLTCMLFISFTAFSQIQPPGYEREMKMREAQKQLTLLDRDSITLVDTVVVFDPTTYEESTTITVTTYSLRDYCKNMLGMNDPDILMDNQQHTIIDPKNYGDLIIRLNPSGKIDTIPQKE